MDGERQSAIETFCRGSGTAILIGAQTVRVDAVPATSGRLIFPGSFDPFHDGHRRMAELAAERGQRTVEFELSIHNVDKPPLGVAEICRRLSGLPDAGVWLTRAATFAEKSQCFPAATFVIGADTLHRLVDLAYYAGSRQRRAEAFAALAIANCRFLVFGRANADGTFEQLGDFELPPPLHSMCEGFSEVEFRSELSSTHLRKATGPG